MSPRIIILGAIASTSLTACAVGSGTTRADSNFDATEGETSQPTTPTSGASSLEPTDVGSDTGHGLDATDTGDATSDPASTGALAATDTTFSGTTLDTDTSSTDIDATTATTDPSGACGDGAVDPGEGCDDGNDQGGDGCSSMCQPESGVLSIVPGDYHMCALLVGGAVRCWGAGSDGQLGNGTGVAYGAMPGQTVDLLEPVDLGRGVTALALAAGTDHNCAIVPGGLLKCWGLNNHGQLGLGDVQNRGDGPEEMGEHLPYVNLGAGKQVAAVTAGEMHTCALLTDGTVKCWGAGAYLGLGSAMKRGATPGTMGDNLPTVDLGAGKTAAMIDAGDFHTCALLDDATIKCWGSNDGQLGYEDTAARGDGPGEMGDDLPAVDLGIGKTPISVSSGDNHTCALLANGHAKCWGNNVYGQLGIGTQTNHGDAVGTMGEALPLVKLGEGKSVADIDAGQYRTCARLTDGRVQCWGAWFLGFTGQYVGDEPDEVGDNLPPADLGTDLIALEMSAKNLYTCVSLSDATVKCWGLGEYGALGLGDTMDRGDTDESMGDNLPALPL